jgi:hypothetical protein
MWRNPKQWPKMTWKHGAKICIQHYMSRSLTDSTDMYLGATGRNKQHTSTLGGSFSTRKQRKGSCCNSSHCEIKWQKFFNRQMLLWEGNGIKLGLQRSHNRVCRQEIEGGGFRVASMVMMGQLGAGPILNYLHEYSPTSAISALSTAANFILFSLPLIFIARMRNLGNCNTLSFI